MAVAAEVAAVAEAVVESGRPRLEGVKGTAKAMLRWRKMCRTTTTDIVAAAVVVGSAVVWVMATMEAVVWVAVMWAAVALVAPA